MPVLRSPILSKAFGGLIRVNTTIQIMEKQYPCNSFILGLQKSWSNQHGNSSSGWKGRGYVHLLGALEWAEGLIIQDPPSWAAHIFSSFLSSSRIAPQNESSIISTGRGCCVLHKHRTAHGNPTAGSSPALEHTGGKGQHPLLNHYQPSDPEMLSQRRAQSWSLLPAKPQSPAACLAWRLGKESSLSHCWVMNLSNDWAEDSFSFGIFPPCTLLYFFLLSKRGT